MQLRGYQEELVSSVMKDIELEKNTLVHLPTGGGKTLCFFEVCKRFLEKRPTSTVCILLNRVLLLEQTINRIENIFPKNMIGIVCGSLNKRNYAPVTIATIGTVNKFARFGLTIVDESHMITLENNDSAYMQFLSNQQLILGVTATPWRASGYIYGKDKLWNKLTYTKPITEMIDEGWLVKPIIKKTNEEYDLTGIKTVMGDYAQDELSNRVENITKIEAQVKESLEKSSDRKHIMWVCVSINHAEMVKHKLEEKGEVVSIIHSLMPKKEIELAKCSFEQGHSRHLVSVSMATTGIDIPIADALIMLRPTKSSSLWVQTVGRVLRTSEDKKDALVLDYGRCAENCGPLDRPKIKGKGRNNILQDPPPMKFCSGCFSYIPVASVECPDCGKFFPKKENKDETKNLTPKASDAPLLSKDITPKAVDVSSLVAINTHQGKVKKCIKITFFPKNLFSREIYDFVFDNNIHNKFKRIGINGVFSIKDAERYNGIKVRTDIKQIIVSYKGNYPEVIDVRR